MILAKCRVPETDLKIMLASIYAAVLLTIAPSKAVFAIFCKLPCALCRAQAAVSQDLRGTAEYFSNQEQFQVGSPGGSLCKAHIAVMQG